jgi:hypothetical protein
VPPQLARILVVLLALTGLGVEGRVLYAACNEPQRFVEAWNVGGAHVQAGLIEVFVVPACFYAFCITTCVVRLQKRTLIACSVAILLLFLRDR